MPDVVDRKTRSRMMSGIRSRNTRPELVIRSELHKLGYRFRLHSAKLPGRPDLVLPGFQIAIHIHGCFWHGHNCSIFKRPGTRRKFWSGKFMQNRKRDKIVVQKTLDAGWRHLTLWECAFRGPDQIGLDATMARVVNWISGKRRLGVIRSRR